MLSQEVSLPNLICSNSQWMTTDLLIYPYVFNLFLEHKSLYYYFMLLYTYFIRKTTLEIVKYYKQLMLCCSRTKIMGCILALHYSMLHPLLPHRMVASYPYYGINQILFYIQIKIQNIPNQDENLPLQEQHGDQVEHQRPR